MSKDCPHCGRTLPNASALDDHVDRVHPDEDEPTNWTPLLVGALVVLAVGVAGFALVTGGGDASEGLHLKDSPRNGDDDAPVAFVAFESPACTSCRLFHIERGGEASTFHRITEAYVDTGDVLYVEKFARAGYGWDRVGANAQRCAWHLGAWPAFESLTQSYYQERNRISGSNAAGFALEWSQRTDHVDPDAFSACFEERRHDDELTRDLSDGRQADVSGTPTFLVIGPDGSRTQIVGPQPFETFQDAIERQLAKADPAPSGNGTAEEAGNESANDSANDTDDGTGSEDGDRSARTRPGSDT